MKKLRNILMCVAIGGMFVGCQDLDIPPKNILSGEDIYNEGGITAYMAGLYSQLPMEDFNMSNDGSYNGFYNWNCIIWDMLSTGETVNRNNTGIYIPQKGYWSMGYKTIRQANDLIANLPAYVGKLKGAESWIAEAKFIRAYVYFAMVKRYGGVPILETPQEMTNDEKALWVARSSHEECIDFILSDLDYAIENLGKTKVAGRANNTYVAAAFKSRVALYAGSVARYGQIFNYSGSESGKMLTGIPEGRANDYFMQAYKASKIVEEGGYKLYEGNSDKEANFREIFANADKSDESILVRQYSKNDFVHSFDAVYCPPRMTATYGDRYNVTLDWVELFDGLPIDPVTGYLKTTDDDGNYIVYNDVKDLLDNAEPRLRGSILLPGHTYKGVELDIRFGIIKEEIDPSTPIAKFIKDDGQTTVNYTSNAWFKNNVLTTTENVKEQKPYETSTGMKLNKSGMDGPANGGTSNTLTGFHGAKWLNLNWTIAETQLHSSTQSWIDIRYAEILLNRAEAALELYQNGVATIDGKDMQQDAYECINKIRSRAGAELLTSPAELSNVSRDGIERGQGIRSFVFAPNEGMHIIRVERYKELAFEHKIYWDLRRWFTFDSQIYQYRRRMLSPFLFAKGATVNEAGNPVGKYIFDTRVCERANNSLTFATKNYYDKIPDGERKVNPLLEQNNQY